MKDLYMTTKKLAGKYSRPERPVKDKQGQNITDSEQLLERWAEHFEELLNRPAPENPPYIAEAEIDIDIDCDPPTREEIIRAITKMKNGKAAGPDGIPAEALKVDVKTTVDMLLPLFVKIWEQEETPTDWKDGHIYYQVAQERWPQQLWELQRRHTHVSAGEGVQPESVGEDEGRSGCQAPGSPGGLQAGQILYRPDRHVTYYSRAVPGVEFLVVRKLRGFPQGFWQSSSWHPVATPPTLWDSSQIDTHHQRVVRGNGLSGCSWRPVDASFRREDRCSSGLPSVAVPVSPRHRLGDEADDGWTERRHPVDPLDSVRRPWLCWWSRSALPQSTTDTEQHHKPSLPCLPSRPPDLPPTRPKSWKSMPPAEKQWSWETTNWKRSRFSPTLGALSTSREEEMQTLRPASGRQEQRQ